MKNVVIIKWVYKMVEMYLISYIYIRFCQLFPVQNYIGYLFVIDSPVCMWLCFWVPAESGSWYTHCIYLSIEPNLPYLPNTKQPQLPASFFLKISIELWMVPLIL